MTLAYTTYSEAGGVAKTTLAANLAAADDRDGRNVLAIDLDPQEGSLTHLLGADVERDHGGDTIAHHLIDRAMDDFEELIVETGSGIDLVPSHNRLENLEDLLNRAEENADTLGQEFVSFDRLRPVLMGAGVPSEYDTIVVDPPATPGPQLYNAISATHNLVVPVEPTGKGEAAVDGLEGMVPNLEDRLATARDADSVNVGVLAVVPNRVGQSNDQRRYVEKARNRGYDAPVAFGERRSLFEGCWSEQCTAFDYIDEYRDRERDYELETLEKIDRLAEHLRRVGDPDVDEEEGMLCSECEREHTDWSKVGEGSVDDGHNTGLITAWKCDHCGTVDEVPVR